MCEYVCVFLVCVICVFQWGSRPGREGGAGRHDSGGERRQL